MPNGNPSQIDGLLSPPHSPARTSSTLSNADDYSSMSESSSTIFKHSYSQAFTNIGRKMMPITVNVGELLECDETDEIRTRGCDPCVALVVIYQNGQAPALIKRCAHFSVNFLPPYTNAIMAQVMNPILAANFPLDGNIVAVGFTWGGNAAGMGSVQILATLTQYFNGLNPLISQDQDSISSNGNVIVLSNLQQWAFTHVPPENLAAELR